MKKMVKFFIITFACILLAILLLCISFIMDIHNNSNVSYSFTNADVGIIKAYDLFAETNAQLKISFDPNAKDDAICYFILEFDNEGSIEIKEDNGKSLAIDNNSRSRNMYLIQFKPTNQNGNCIKFSKGAYHSIVTTDNGKKVENMDPFEYDFVQRDDYIVNTLSFYKDYNVYILNYTNQKTDFILTDFIIYKALYDEEQEKFHIDETYEYTDVKRTITLRSYYKLMYLFGDVLRYENGKKVQNNTPIQISFKDNKNDISNIEIQRIENFKTSLSSGKLSCYPTATEVLYPVNFQDVELFPANNTATEESKLNIKKTITDNDTMNVTGTIYIPKGRGTVADKQISPSFEEWLYGNYSIVILNLITTIFSCCITFCFSQMSNKIETEVGKVAGKEKGKKKKSSGKNGRKV